MNNYENDIDDSPDPVDTAIKIAVTALLIIAVAVGVGALLSSCYSEKKATKQVEKALEEYPGPTISVIRDEYPCTDGDTIVYTSFDSTEFVRTRDSALDEAFINKLTLQGMIARLKSFDQAVQDLCGDYAVVIDALYAENTRLRDAPAKIKPVKEIVEKVVTVEDFAKIFIANSKAEKFQKLYEADHAWREVREKKDKGNAVVRIPWWVIALLGATTVFIAFTKLKTGGLNPVKLFTKK